MTTYSKTGLSPMQAMVFSVAANIICDASGANVMYSSSSYEGGFKMVDAYTAPEFPVPYFFGEQTESMISIGLDNPGSNSWGVPYHLIRLGTN